MTQKTIKAERAVEIGEAVAVVGDNRYLEGSTAFKLGMLGDNCKPIVKNYVKERDRIMNDARKRQKIIVDAAKDGGAEARAKANEDIAALNEEIQEKVNELGTQDVEVKIPSLKLSEFIAKSDVTDVFVKDGVSEAKVVVKSGQALVPVKFFTMMGDVIVDDKNVQT